MDIRLDGKRALITGASSGIGQAIAIGLAQAGADIAVNYRRPDSLRGARVTADGVEAAGRKAVLIEADLADIGAIDRMFDQLDSGLGGIDILVNNAGIGGEGSGVEQTVEAWEAVLATNLTAPFACSRLAVERMRRQGAGGVIVNITSVHEEAPGGGSPAYTVSKGGLRNLTRSLGLALAPEGIRVIAVAPGMILTKMNAAATNDPGVAEAAAKLIPARRPGTPEDIANTVVFLASEQASYVTGSSVFVDGGWMLEWPEV